MIPMSDVLTTDKDNPIYCKHLSVPDCQLDAELQISAFNRLQQNRAHSEARMSDDVRKGQYKILKLLVLRAVGACCACRRS